MISIVCPVYNKLEYTKKCLASLKNCIAASGQPERFEIVLVDDGSTDGTAEFVKKNHPEVRVLTGDGNLWWSGGMNMGAHDALSRGAEYIFVMNNDVGMPENYFGIMLKFLNSTDLSVIGSLIKKAEDGTIWSAGGYYDRRRGCFDMYKAVPDYQSPYFEVDWLTGMGTLIHRTVFEKIGFWNEKDFPQYYGDADFTLRAQEAGFRVVVNPNLELWNDTRNSGLNAHRGSFVRLVTSLFSQRSHYHVGMTLKFFLAHQISFVGLSRIMWVKHGRYVGGFFKHKFLGLFKKS